MKNQKRLLGFVCEYMHRTPGNLDIIKSFDKRHNLLEEGYIKNQELINELEKTKNMPYIYKENLILNSPNEFEPIELFLKPEANSSTKYLKLKDFGLSEKDVYFIENESQLKEDYCQDVFQQKLIGLDTESSIIFGIAAKMDWIIFQIATLDKILIFDSNALGKTKEFHKYLIKLLSNDEIIKVGHSLKEDFTLSNFYFPQAFTFRNYFDLPRAYKYMHPHEKKYGLSYLAQQAYPDREMSKYEQTSNWLRRPLRKTQMHYAALDAFICLKLFQIYEKYFIEKFGKILSDFHVKSEEEILKLEEAERQNKLGFWRKQYRAAEKKQVRQEIKSKQNEKIEQKQQQNQEETQIKLSDPSMSQNVQTQQLLQQQENLI